MNFNMIKILSRLALTLSIVFSAGHSSLAQSNTEPMSEMLTKQKSEAGVFISRTARLLLDVQSQVAKGKVFNGDFSAAVNHTRQAIALYKSGSFRRAAMHAEFARRLAVKASNANKGKVDASLVNLNEQEKSIMNGPKLDDAELVNEVAKLMKGKPVVSEANLVSGALNDLGQSALNTVLK